MQYPPLSVPTSGSMSGAGNHSKAARIRERLRMLLCRSSDVGIQRKQIERQLLSRELFPLEDWVSVGCDPIKARRILELIQHALDWPNCFFAPNDPLELAFLDPYEFSSQEFLNMVSQERGIRFSSADVALLQSANATLETLVRLILAWKVPKGDGNNNSHK